ncbi:hypothetical protein, partial [Mesorhizobium sp. M8A.F.Ca.ET.181.01.1.1]|uniref:hypothetical protein n=1 Tax=Mesorhizobium sp. M8A.F.Ca.ET.181.01.1.1 TaxID=2563963 RepID=UPI001AEF1027
NGTDVNTSTCLKRTVWAGIGRGPAIPAVDMVRGFYLLPRDRSTSPQMQNAPQVLAPCDAFYRARAEPSIPVPPMPERGGPA